MRICLQSGRRLQLGCGLKFNRCHVFNSFLYSNVATACLARQHVRNSATSTKTPATISREPAPFREVSNDGGYFYSQRLSAIRPREPHNTAAWIRQLEPYLPPDLRNTGFDVPTIASFQISRPHEYSESEGESIAKIIRHARLLGDLDLLAYLGFTLQRWPAVYALITKMLDTADSFRETAQHLQGLPSNLKWQDGTLKYISSETNAKDHKNESSPIVSGFVKSPLPISMEHFTDAPRNNTTSLEIMGEVWQSLGFIVVTAADKPADESELAMSYVYQTFARLHHSGNISDAIYKASTRGDDGVLFRPPGMHMLSTHIMNVLSDAAWLVHQAHVTAKAKAAGEDAPYRSFKMGIRQLGHGIWLELILWSCVEQGLIKEGAWILKCLQRDYGTIWKMASWNSLLDQPDFAQDINIDTNDYWPHPAIERTTEEAKHKSGSFHGLGKLTISAEVVASLANNAANYAMTTVNPDSTSFEDMVKLITFLNTTKQSSSSETPPDLSTAGRQIIQVLEFLQGLQPGIEPKSLEQLVHSLPYPMPPWDDSVPLDHQSLYKLQKHDIYSASSMLIGLLEQNLRSYSTHREIESAIQTFTRLLGIIDSSKMGRIQEFWNKEKKNEGDHNDRLSLQQRSFPEAPVQIDQSSIPTLSNGTLADLLDLVTACKAFEFGEWLFFSSAADGPVISFESYSDQGLAPSILRFAAATNNQELGEVVIQELKSPISRNTFNALVIYRIAVGQWDEAEQILDLLRQYRRKTWGESTLAALGSAILRLEQRLKEEPSDKETEESLLRAQSLLHHLLSGEYNPKRYLDKDVNTHYDRSIYRWHGVLSSIPGALSRACSDVKHKYTHKLKRDTLPYLPSVAFHVLLDAVVETRGSLAGMEMWERWCVDIERSHAPRLTEDGLYRLQKSADPNTEDLELEYDWPWFWEKQRKAVIPNLHTLRVITRAAVKEFKTIDHSQKKVSAADAKFKHDVYRVLDFCVERYRRFKKEKDEIDRETSGHVRRQRKTEANMRKNLRRQLLRWVYEDVQEADGSIAD